MRIIKLEGNNFFKCWIFSCYLSLTYLQNVVVKSFHSIFKIYSIFFISTNIIISNEHVRVLYKNLSFFNLWSKDKLPHLQFNMLFCVWLFREYFNNYLMLEFVLFMWNVFQKSELSSKSYLSDESTKCCFLIKYNKCKYYKNIGSYICVLNSEWSRYILFSI
jgi:hypothetical protein